ncbi:hypothetical protein [Gimesia fumaroli]|uniref:Uncharacterized protein n=1 Tax=Gimesia fumaroli TaxID=2527976 RepID=A0A518I7S3_9PLAN|nr:hypothetical protein [Gimesia fumaroli]QDV49157.1 hypothetical protein Enr17x_11740 [Gimesia fumaroli]
MPRMFPRISVPGLLLLFAGTLTGCGSDVTLYNVKGKVEFDGKPLPYGQIKFIPDSSKDNKGGGGYAEIIEGEYDTAKNGKGTMGGPHILEISGFDGVTQGTPPTGENSEEETEYLANGKMLFFGYRTELDLPEEEATQDLTIPADAAKQNPYDQKRRRAANEP